MRVGLRLLKPEAVEWLRRELQRGELSRAALGRGLCEQDGWRNPRGELCAASARKALPQLASQLCLALPPAQPGPPRGCWGQRAGAARRALTEFGGSLEELGEVGLRVAETETERKLCAGLLAAGHPRGRARAPGCRLTYLLEAAAGPLGVLSFVSAPLRLGPRDAHLGWDARTRGSHIQQVVSNDRFLLLPGVRVPNLASHVLGRAVGRLAADWEARHGVRPVLVETCVEASRPATSYRAAGWECVGRTAGRPPGSAGAAEPKRVWLRGLEADWEQTLRRAPVRAPGSFPALAVDDEASWARREFQRSDLADGRLRKRLERLGASWERHPGQPLPAIFPGSAEQQAAYRFLHNNQVHGEDILQPHREALVERCRLESTVLLVQDTTTLNYSGLKDSTKGLGPLQERNGSARGLFVHAAVAFTPGRRPLGVSGLETWARPEAEPEAEREKESRRWFRGFDQGRELGRASPHTRVVVVGDRESDIYALLKWQAEHAEEAGLVVRANASRQRRVQVWDQQLRATMLRTLESQPDFETPVKTGREVLIDSQGGKRARRQRTAVTELRIGPGGATAVRRQLLLPVDDNYSCRRASCHARSPWAARQPPVPTDPDRRPARATPRSRTRQAIPARRPATPGTVPATPGASAPRRSTAVAAISGPLADGTGSGIRRPSAAPGNVPAAPRSSTPHDYATPLRNGPGGSGRPSDRGASVATDPPLGCHRHRCTRARWSATACAR